MTVATIRSWTLLIPIWITVSVVVALTVGNGTGNLVELPDQMKLKKKRAQAVHIVSRVPKIMES
jgi:hypothetical protein